MVELDFCLYAGLTDRTPKQMSATWPELAERLTEFNERIGKEGPLWSPSLIAKGETRSNANVVSVSCLVLDFDDGHDWSDFEGHWSGLEYVLHTTHQHTVAAPRWRAVFPLAEPVHGLDWPAIYRKLVTHLACGVCDPSCKDASRMYYLPSCGIGAERFSKHQQGRTLDPGQYTDVPEEESLPDVIQAPPMPGDGLRPGDDFNNRATWDEILLTHGWQRPKWKSGDKVSWTRPGKPLSEGASAITGGARHGDRFYCFSSSVKEVPTGKLLDKFALYAHLNHRGDFADAAKTLARKGYGERVRAVATLDEPAPEVVDGFYLTDLGNAERFVAEHGDRIRYCHTFRRWLTWNGRYWEIDQTGGAPIYQLACETVRSIRKQAAELTNADDRKKLWNWANACEAKVKLEAMISLAQRMRGIPVTPEELDTRPLELVCLNGTYDFSTNEFHEGYFDTSALTTKGLSIPYDENAECPLWDKFMKSTLPDIDLLHYVWKAAGYSLTGSTAEAVFFFLYGNGKNGKSTFMEVLQAVLGDYSRKTSADALTIKKNDNSSGPNNDIARLRGARLVVASELQSHSRLNEALIKDLTGGDTITARFLHQEFFDFTLEAKIWMFGNHKPQVRGTDTGIWRRVALLPFTQTVAPEDQIKDLNKKIIATELPGVLAWMVEGWKAYTVVGLEQPAMISEAVAAYRQEQDVIGAFLEECTERKHAYSESGGKLFEAFKRWAKENNEFAGSHKAFTTAMKERGCAWHVSNGRTVWDEITLTEEARGWLSGHF